jgi:hypothetical protein
LNKKFAGRSAVILTAQRLKNAQTVCLSDGLKKIEAFDAASSDVWRQDDGVPFLLIRTLKKVLEILLKPCKIWLIEQWEAEIWRGFAEC